jgi:Na+/melibiose symporter-like transporter
MLPLSVFKNRSFTAASLAVTLTVFALAGTGFFVSQYYQTIRGYDTLKAGLALLPAALTFFFVSQQAVRISKRLNAKQSITLGIGMTALGMLIMAFTFRSDTTYLETLIGQMFSWIGMAIAISPATNVIMSSVPQEKAGVGSAVNDTTREVGGALGVAILGALMFASYRAGVGQLGTLLPQLSPELLAEASSSIQGAHAVAATLPADAARVVIDTANAAFVSGTNEAMFIGAVIAGLGALLVFVALPAKLANQQEEAPEADFKAQVVAAAGD